jgi:hypothetical protein
VQAAVVRREEKHFDVEFEHQSHPNTELFKDWLTMPHELEESIV